LSTGLKTLSRVLISQIGGSMGPLYGTFFRYMAKQCRDLDRIDADTFAAMLGAARQGIGGISTAQVGDKTMIDVLVPAGEAFQNSLKEGMDFSAALEKMSEVAGASRDATEDMVAKVGRSSRLGERSRGVIDAGAASCCLILQTFAESIQKLLAQGDAS
jgi:dihydroxyacetone kinase-like protein